ncbi:DUF5666 domain-containing protein [Patescibacteria group bacterium]|nr:DUF5666 domain-containing protein [Patescibacteria group bacterium]
MKNNVVSLVLVAVVFGAIGFYGGTLYQKNQQPSLLTQFGNRTGQFAAGQNARFRNGGGRVVGQIVSVDSSSMTVKMQDGSSKIVLFSDKTAIDKAASASASDLKNGEAVSVFGTTNSDGSVTAQNIQLNPIMRQAPQQ